MTILGLGTQKKQPTATPAQIKKEPTPQAPTPPPQAQPVDELLVKLAKSAKIRITGLSPDNKNLALGYVDDMASPVRFDVRRFVPSAPWILRVWKPDNRIESVVSSGLTFTEAKKEARELIAAGKSNRVDILLAQAVVLIVAKSGKRALGQSPYTIFVDTNEVP